MTLFLQSVLLFAAGIGLFLLWRFAAPSERWLKLVVAAGFLARAVAGQLLFWISWARLPIARSLQMGDGFWIFAQDSTFYFPQAVAAVEQGWRAILFFDRGAAAPSYMQLLACSIALFGRIASIALLPNLFCYLGTVAVLVRWSRTQPQTRTAVAVAVTAISLSPAMTLWSLQPLKECFFQLLFVGFVAACAAWQRAWMAQSGWAKRAGIGALLAIFLFLLAGMRWYFAAVLLCATSLFLVMMALVSPERKRSLAAAAVMIIVLWQSLAVSAGPYLPPALAPSSLLAAVDEARRGFDASPASTMIKAGRRLEAKLVAPAPVTVRPLAPAAASRPAPKPASDESTAVRAAIDRQVEAWNGHQIERLMDGYWNSPDVELRAGAFVVRGWQPMFEHFQRMDRSGALGRLNVSEVRMSGEGGSEASASGRWELRTSDRTESSEFTLLMRRFPGNSWKVVRMVANQPPAKAPDAASATIVPPKTQPPPEPPRMPRLLAGAAALVLPRTLGAPLGLFDVGGGRGMLWFAEIDTVVFDAVLLIALLSLTPARAAAAWRNPLTWLVLLTPLLLVAPLVYSISNFGTLFRLREMIYLGLLLIPVAVAASSRDALPLVSR